MVFIEYEIEWGLWDNYEYERLWKLRMDGVMG